MTSSQPIRSDQWLPITREEALKRGWDEVDVIIVSGDAYVDHPAFGHAVVARLIESQGLRVALIPQPNWQDDLRDFRKFGPPRLFFGVTSGCMDSMVNHYTAGRRRRSNDAYTPGGTAGFRPDHAVTTYTKILKSLYPHVPVVIGGMEASMRRATHYDYWSDGLRPSILLESGADLLVYGMGEQPLLMILRLLARGVPFASLQTVPQTAVVRPAEAPLPLHKGWKTLTIASHEACVEDRKTFAGTFKTLEEESNRIKAARLVQQAGDRQVIINPPFPPMAEEEIDRSFDLPFTRRPHPKYKKRGDIPAFEMIKFSVTLHRGCFGGCSFCAISAHQGRTVVSRSPRSILREIDNIAAMGDFKGYISDLGGPSANMYKMTGRIQERCDHCARPSCIDPHPCNNLETSHRPLLEIYRAVSAHPAVKKAFVTSGIRYDLFLDKTKEEEREGGYGEYLDELVSHHVSGRLKVAPEHTADRVLRVMRKPSFRYFRLLKERFEEITRRRGLRQEIIPYFISSHPGSEVADMAELAVETKGLGFQLDQVQDFTPTPMTLATVIYYSGYHPYTLKPLYSARSEEERRAQNRFFFWHKPENRGPIGESLRAVGREDLIDKLLEQAPRPGPGGRQRSR